MSGDKRCRHCDTWLLDDAVYCHSCGFKVREWDQAQSEKGELEQPSTIVETVKAFMSLIRRTPLQVAPSATVFLERQPRSMLVYAASAVVLLFVGLGISYGGDWLTYIGFTVAGYAVPLIVLAYIVRSDVYEREPIVIVAYCFGWGAFSGLLAGVLNSVITEPFLGAGGAGLIEEPLKIWGVYQIAKSARMKNEFNDHLDGIIYGAAAGAGFAGLENFWYISEMVLNNAYPALFAIAIRSITGVMHISWSAIAGRSLGVAKATRGIIRRSDMLPGILIAAGIHFLWNTLSTDIAFFLILPFTLSGLRNMIAAAIDDEKRWGFEFFAPDEKE
ncbi:PrsW family intramembrane metalloprotease [Candidatus Bathyarchaeota archaeon]|nr:PrsW family intramembrane metalloprotease [Candidatus Bathyarchaeota archaeon]